MTSLTTDDAAASLGIDPATLRRWVMKGWIHPVLPRGKPLRFRPDEVERARAGRLTEADHAEIDGAWERLSPGSDTSCAETLDIKRPAVGTLGD
jgi:hypothetical protein